MHNPQRDDLHFQIDHNHSHTYLMFVESFHDVSNYLKEADFVITYRSISKPSKVPLPYTQYRSIPISKISS